MFSFLFLQMWQSLSKSVIFQWSNDSVFFNRLTGEVGTWDLWKVALLFVRRPDTLSLGCRRREPLSTQKPYFTSQPAAQPVRFFSEKWDQKRPLGAVAKEKNWPLSSQGLCRRDLQLWEKALLWHCDHSDRELRPGVVALLAVPPPSPLSAPGVVALLDVRPPPLPFYKPICLSLWY